mmetsp:Transcript_19169/g.34716  ORF Transcript_19169/g.34716 Transcript_19169/m.34716 type:complete len:92 (+) Transcript_19169:440-715(+)
MGFPQDAAIRTSSFDSLIPVGVHGRNQGAHDQYLGMWLPLSCGLHVDASRSGKMNHPLTSRMVNSSMSLLLLSTVFLGGPTRSFSLESFPQ